YVLNYISVICLCSVTRWWDIPSLQLNGTAVERRFWLMEQRSKPRSSREAITIVSPPPVKSPIPKPPKVLSQLTAEACQSSVRMSCLCESNVREVVWYVNGKRLSQSSRFEMRSSEGSCSLLIHDLADNDQGEYTCEMTSEGGVSKSSFSFTGQVFQSIHLKIKAYREQQLELKGEHVSHCYLDLAHFHGNFK
uniref:Ig-like domain-containing protein n=1 Tax=Mola mola TaxID=94237 RepID=A0A3Q3X2P6_MOLML